MNSKLAKWNDAYKNADIKQATPASILKDHAYLLPVNLPPHSGEALDLACGRAGNAIFLAKKGFEVDAIDISAVVLKELTTFVQQKKLSINCIERDIEKDGLTVKKYDVIIVSYFLNRQLFPQIVNALKPNGVLFYQTWSQLSCDKSGPSNPDFRLKEAELLTLSKPLRIIYYQENGTQGDISQGPRNEALVIAQKMK